jgi:hypothetical protein
MRGQNGLILIIVLPFGTGRRPWRFQYFRLCRPPNQQNRRQAPGANESPGHRSQQVSPRSEQKYEKAVNAAAVTALRVFLLLNLVDERLLRLQSNQCSWQVDHKELPHNSEKLFDSLCIFNPVAMVNKS